MQCTVHFLLLNDDYSPEHAKANNVEESAINRKYEWRDELKITTNVLDITEKVSANYSLKGTLEDGSEFSHSIPLMRLFTLQGDEPIVIGCSELLFKSVEIIKEEFIIINIILKDYEPFMNPVPGIYIATGNFPNELVS